MRCVRSFIGFLALFAATLMFSCGGSEEAAEGGGGQSSGGRGGPPGGFGGFGGGASEATAIPVEVAAVERRTISDYLQTTGALEAENEVDIVARTSGPIVALETEEGRRVSRGQLLAKIDDRELTAELELARVSVEETRAAYERAKTSFEAEILSANDYDVTKARFETAKAQLESREIQLSYTEIRAPFAGQVIERAVKFGEYVSNGTRLFRISDFDPLLCPVQVPEKDLSRISIGQSALIRVEAFPGENFEASVLRVNPVIDQTNGTFKVTLQVRGRGKLRPGMFASVFLEVASNEDALVIPKRALVLEGVGDTVYVFDEGVAARREVELGFEESDAVEVTSGLVGSEQVIVLGQDSLTEGTPIYILEEAAAPSSGRAGRPGMDAPAARGGGPGGPGGDEPSVAAPAPASESSGERAAAPAAAAPAAAPAPSGAPNGAPGQRGGRPQIDWDDPQQVEAIRERMRARGMSDEQVDAMIERMKSGAGRPGGAAGDGRRGPSSRGSF